ncbi:MAG: bifunctional acetate--CoA ligase family protein/GNAT family N-acetyltransferase [Rhodospirillales bacterium]|nr:bifunctional acetate--CoA ligase family protein/GNAT family N-acetyltransferase [Rhodospirillales bacterium]
MSIRNLECVFKPRSIALVGASKATGVVGARLAHNLFNAGFEGPIMPVDPRYRAVEGVLCYAKADDLPVVPELVIIATPPATVPGLIADFAARGSRAAIVIPDLAAGLGAVGSGGTAHGDNRAVEDMLACARLCNLRIIGPDSLGVMAPRVGLNASWAHCTPKAGELAFVAQSGAIVSAVLDWATARGIGFSHLVALGGIADVDFADMLDYLAQAGEVRGILLYIERVTNARKFMSAARAASRLKPVIVVKGGRFQAAEAAVPSPDGAACRSDAVYDAAFRRAGMLRVLQLDDLFGAVETLGMGLSVGGDRLAIVTNGGSVGRIAADAVIEGGGRLAVLSPATLDALKELAAASSSRRNPVDIGDDAPGERYGRAVEIALADEAADAVLVLYCPTAIASAIDAADAVVAAARGKKRPVLACWLGADAASAARRRFAGHRIASYGTPERAVRAFLHLVEYRRNQDALTQTPPSIPEAFVPGQAAVRRILDEALAAGQDWLSEPHAKAVLAAYHLPTVPTRIAANAKEAAALAAAQGGPVVLKIVSPDIAEKSRVGGVALDLRSPALVRDAAEAMARRVREQLPEARLHGFAIQPMVSRPGAFELRLGVREDPQFGPVILFGQGGIAAETINDAALALPPLNMHLAREVMTRTRIFDSLAGGLGRPPVAIDDLALSLIQVSQLIIDFAEVVELDINPLLADEFGIVALDARIRVVRRDEPPAKRLAIRPYPKELEEALTLPDGRMFALRPVLPEDEPAFQRLFLTLSADDVRLRFFAPKKALTHPFAARLTQIDYDREMALVLATPDPPGQGEVFGAVHASADANGERAEFAILLRRDLVGLGLGPMLMRRIIDYSRAAGIRQLFGEVLRENTPMLRVCDLFGFERRSSADDPGVVEVILNLTPPPA